MRSPDTILEVLQWTDKKLKASTSDDPNVQEAMTKLREIVGRRVYHNLAPPKSTYPYILHTVENGPSVYGGFNASIASTPRLLIKCVVEGPSVLPALNAMQCVAAILPTSECPDSQGDVWIWASFDNVVDYAEVNKESGDPIHHYGHIYDLFAERV